MNDLASVVLSALESDEGDERVRSTDIQAPVAGVHSTPSSSSEEAPSPPKALSTTPLPPPPPPSQRVKSLKEIATAAVESSDESLTESATESILQTMPSLIYVHDACAMHDIPGHPEQKARVLVIAKALKKVFPQVPHRFSRKATWEELQLFHSAHHLQIMQTIFKRVSTIAAQMKQQAVSAPDGKRSPSRHNRKDILHIDPDTSVMPHTEEAALRAAGSLLDAIDDVMNDRCINSFCVVRPPGHHATPHQAMGFCLFNNVGIGALYARQKYGVQRIAIIDFDVHHGNGTQDFAENDPDLFYGSSHQGNFYPGTGHVRERGINNNVVNVPLRSGAGSKEFRKAYAEKILPKLELFRPQLLLISAGFDAHKDDSLAELRLTEDDYYWVTKELTRIAEIHCDGRIVSALEGGYNLQAIAASSVVHMKALLESSEAVLKKRTTDRKLTPKAAEEEGAENVKPASTTQNS